MGGVPPLGYQAQDGKLLVIEGEAKIVRINFRRYAVLGSVRVLKEELEARGVKSKWWTTASGRRVRGKPFSRGASYLMLQNRLYRGEIPSQGTVSPRRTHGDHRSAFQAQLASATPAPALVSRACSPGCVRRRRQSDGADPCDQEGDALPLLCLATADHRSDRAILLSAHPSRENRASGDQPVAPKRFKWR